MAFQEVRQMKRSSVLLLVAMLAPQPVLAKAESGAARKPAKVKFDPAKVVTVNGLVLAEQRVDHGKGVKSVRLILKVGGEQLSVHLGPDTWVDRQKVRFAKGDEVAVKGSKFTYDGGAGLIAQSVTRGGDTLVVRDTSGKPAWSGQVAKQ
jgi:hypothetical protein